MIRIIINDLSFVGQAQDEHEAEQLLRDLSAGLTALRTHLGTASVHRPRTMKTVLVTQTLSLGAFLGRSTMRRDERELLLTQLTKGPYLDSPAESTASENPLPKHECQYNNQSLPNSVLAHAAYFSSGEPFFGTHSAAALLSIGKSPDFQQPTLNIVFLLDEAVSGTKTKGRRKKGSAITSTTRTVWNVTSEQQVTAVRRCYEPNSGKHAVDKRQGGFISPMDLNDDQARLVLADGVLLPEETRVFGRYQRKYYIFPCHDAQRNAFHGFRVDETEIRDRMKDVYAQLRRIGFFNDS